MITEVSSIHSVMEMMAAIDDADCVPVMDITHRWSPTPTLAEFFRTVHVRATMMTGRLLFVWHAILPITSLTFFLLLSPSLSYCPLFSSYKLHSVTAPLVALPFIAVVAFSTYGSLVSSISVNTAATTTLRRKKKNEINEKTRRRMHFHSINLSIRSKFISNFYPKKSRRIRRRNSIRKEHNLYYKCLKWFHNLHRRFTLETVAASVVLMMICPNRNHLFSFALLMSVWILTRISWLNCKGAKKK